MPGSSYRPNTAGDHLSHQVPRRRALWPVPVSSLSALVDLGMSDEGIGRYLAVSPEAIARLRAKHHLPLTDR
ncbi:hypothetical protein [Oleomonas cavernae]|uniref:hypothetical protein n=1 Tax=Oleomonas cavernae TaxID=2320859 RepID=UPI0011C482CA|nr:hypothetical protein [Oleomonas cavernae]